MATEYCSNGIRLALEQAMTIGKRASNHRLFIKPPNPVNPELNPPHGLMQGRGMLFEICQGQKMLQQANNRWQNFLLGNSADLLAI